MRGKSCNIEGARKAHSEDYVYTIIEAGAEEPSETKTINLMWESETYQQEECGKEIKIVWLS